jgi:acyl-CoA synthetase (AMP-forming)/AMP-acid ligase II
VKKGDTVAVILPTTPEFTDVFFAIIHLGAIPVPLYPPVRLGRLDEYFRRTGHMLQQSGTKILVTDQRAGKLMGSLVQKAARPIQIVRVDQLVNAVPVPPSPPQSDDIAMVQFSSGTTGPPKPVALTHGQVMANARVILDIEPEDDDFCPAGVTWLPLYHDMGLIGCIFPAILYPGSLTLIPPEAFLADPAIWLRTLSRYRGVISPAPNFAYALCTERIHDDDIQDVDLSGWRFALNGAEATSPDTMRAFIDRFQPFGLRPEALTPVYGLSEAALAVTFGVPHSPFSSERFSRSDLQEGVAVPCDDGMELASVGRALRGFNVEIRHDEATLNHGQVGRIWVKGPSIMERYLDGSPPPKRGEWLDTGDLGFIHNGELYITGRAKDVLVIRGRNHDPTTVETAIDGLAGVRTGCSAAVADVSDQGEHVFLFVETREPSPPDLEKRIIEKTRGATGITPDTVVLLAPGTLPRTSSGKIRRSEALTRWHSQQLLPPKKVSAVSLVGEVAKSAWSEWRSTGAHHD